MKPSTDFSLKIPLLRMFFSTINHDFLFNDVHNRLFNQHTYSHRILRTGGSSDLLQDVYKRSHTTKHLPIPVTDQTQTYPFPHHRFRWSNPWNPLTTILYLPLHHLLSRQLASQVCGSQRSLSRRLWTICCEARPIAQQVSMFFWSPKPNVLHWYRYIPHSRVWKRGQHIPVSVPYSDPTNNPPLVITTGSVAGTYGNWTAKST